MTPYFLGFKDLQSRGIIRSWPMLRRRIENDGFPVGRMLGPNQRAWTEAEVEAWLKSRPTKGPAPRGIAKRKAERKAADNTDASTAT
jgi:predicted DNA-binding transcriptional regulator AlpA